MKQVVQSIKDGRQSVVEVPAPRLRFNGVLVATAASVVSAGTERMIVDFAGKNLLQKALSRPDLVAQTIDKAKRDGVLATFDAVLNRLDQPMPLGYSSSGTVIAVGRAVNDLSIGTRVACAGGGHAVHAEITSVPRNMVVSLPDNVDFLAAAFGTMGAIALHGVRLAELHLGEVAVVVGLGLLGQITAQILKAWGCLVLAIDPKPERAELARRLGADAVATTEDELSALTAQRSGGRGADAVVIAADTKSNAPVELAARVARDRARVVSVGAVGTELPRKPYFEKELTFLISRSYGPGRYDRRYEEDGIDYPYGYVRWTEQRNIEAFLNLIAAGKIEIPALVSHRFPIDQAQKAYDLISGKSGEPFMAVVLDYPGTADINPTVELAHTSSVAPGTAKRAMVGVLGSGNFANATLLPILRKLDDLDLVGIAGSGGLSAKSGAKRFGFRYCTTESGNIFRDPAINIVAILTRHDMHASQAIEALRSGKHVFVEKPLCLTEEELRDVVDAYEAAGNRMLMVGFNRRFAPFVVELEGYLRALVEPVVVNIRVNAGFIPREHWTNDPMIGGGRLAGECCHFIDLAAFLAGSRIVEVTTIAMDDAGRYAADNLIISARCENGSVIGITYVANGDRAIGKEVIEVFGGGLSARIDDYRSLTIRRGSTKVHRKARLRQDKGHRGEWVRIVAHLTGGSAPPIAFHEIVESTLATFAARKSLVERRPVEVGS
jgi:predicted dehydrogenase